MTPRQSAAGPVVSNLAGVLAQLKVPRVEEGGVCERPFDANWYLGEAIIGQDGRCGKGRVGRRVVDIDSHEIHRGTRRGEHQGGCIAVYLVLAVSWQLLEPPGMKRMGDPHSTSLKRSVSIIRFFFTRLLSGSVCACDEAVSPSRKKLRNIMVRRLSGRDVKIYGRRSAS